MKIMVKGLGIAAFTVMLVFALIGCQESTSSDNVINIAAIQGVTIPVTGATPVRAITENAQYSGTVTWNGNPSTFAAETYYTATITLTAKTGYTLQGVSANFFTVAGAVNVTNNANYGIVTAVFPGTGGTSSNPDVINIAAISGVTVPVAGATPVSVISENSQYSGTVTWNGSPSAFAANTQYTATITLTAKTGYTLQGVAANFFTVAGAASVSNSANSGIVTAVFPATTNITVSISINAPVKGAMPTATASGSGGNFTIGSVSWSPAHNPFLGGTVYTASVTLTANSGFTFTGLSSATVNGQNATVSNNTGSAVKLSHTFPATNTRTVINIAIKTQPTKLTYTHGDTLDLTGLAVTLTHDDTTTEDVIVADFTAKNITANPAQGNKLARSTHNGQPITIYYGSFTKTTDNLTVNAKNASTFTIDAIAAQTYNGSALTPAVTVKDGATTLALTTNYTVSYSNNTNAGTATVTVTGTGDYTGSKTANFTINKKNASTFTIDAIAAQTYNGSALTPVVTVKDGAATLALTTDYTVSYSNNTNAGTATVTVTGTGNYTGSKTANFTINKANSAVTAWPTAAAITYGAALSASTLNGGVAITVGSFAWTAPTTIPTVINSGYSVTFTPTDTANYNIVINTISITVRLGIEMVHITGGTFTMGSPESESGRRNNETQHSVTLTGFSIGKYQVTREQYQAVIGIGWYHDVNSFNSAVTGESGTPDKLPVEFLNWYQTLVFCNRLSIAEGLNPVYSISGKTDPSEWGSVPTSSNSTWDAVIMDKSKNGYRLPTEAEWEYACRAGTTTAFNDGNNDYTNSTLVGAIAWYSENSGSKTHQVGLKAANTWGLYDMHGNVFEWCWDWYSSSSSSPTNNPTGPATGSGRVFRGGDWRNSGNILRSAYRNYSEPAFGSNQRGFRLARSNE